MKLTPQKISLLYLVTGINGETGELSEKIKKICRDGLNVDEHLEALKKELGDILWYIVTMCSELGLNPDEVLEHNVQKLDCRIEKSMLTGSGDNREE